jgi:hypothetical protein
VTDPEPILRGLTTAIGKLTNGLSAVRSQLIAMDAASRARHEEHVRVTQAASDAQKVQAAAVRAAVRILGRQEGDEDPVGEARRERDVALVQTQTAALLGFRAWSARAWARIWSEDVAKYRWAAYMALVGVAREVLADYPILSALVRAIEAAASTGSAP